MADGDAGQLDFSDLGGQRVGQTFDFSDLGGQRVEQADEPPEGFFGKFADLGAISVENHPEWVRGWPLSDGSSAQLETGNAPVSAGQPTGTLDFSDLGGRRVSSARPQVRQQPHGPDFSDLGGVRLGQAAPKQTQKSTWEQLADLNDAIHDAEMRTAVGAAKDLWESAKGIGSLFKPPDFMLHPIEQKPKTPGEAISQGAQAGAYTTGLTTLGRAVKGYYDATRQNIDRTEQAADKGDATGVVINSAAAGLPLVGPLIGGLYEDAQTNDLPTMAGKGISRIGQAMSMAPEGSVIPNPVSTVTKGVVGALSRTGDDAGVSVRTGEAERAPGTKTTETQRGRIAGPAKGLSDTSGLFRRLPADLEELLKRVNPTGSRTNCGRCVEAFVRALNGDDLAAEEGEDFQVEELEDKYGRFQDATIPEIEERLSADGEGAHAIIKGEFKPGPDGTADGHVFNAVRWNDGKVYFVDPQSGEAVTPEDLRQYERFQYVRSD
jgi:hypothetical protein